MSAARPISPISEGAPARSDNDAGSAELSLSEGKTAEPGSSPAIRRRLPDERPKGARHANGSSAVNLWAGLWIGIGTGFLAKPLKRNGRHEETRTPDLYRVNSLTDVKPDDTE